MKLFRKSFSVFFLLATCCASLSWAQSSFRNSYRASFTATQSSLGFGSFPNSHCLELKKGNNEFAYSGQFEGIFYCNPLMLGGAQFDYSTFGLESKGELKLVKGDAKTGKMVEIPFYLHLRRNGVPVTHPCGKAVIFSKVEISVILKVAQDGDELIVEPVNKEDWPAKRIVKIGDKC